jgi:hypothetical protein
MRWNCQGVIILSLGNIKLSLCLTKYHVMKTYPVPSILNLGTRWRWVVSFTTPAALPPGKETLVPLDRRLGGPQSQCGRGGEEKNSQPLPELEPPDHPAHSPKKELSFARQLSSDVSNCLGSYFRVYIHMRNTAQRSYTVWINVVDCIFIHWDV